MSRMYRDDDISVTTNITLLTQVHDLFIKHGRIHTIAVQMKDIWDNKEVWHWLMTAQNLEIALHGWAHPDYSVMTYEDICEDFKRCFEYWDQHLAVHRRGNIKIEKFFPPWNRISADLQRACDRFGLKLDNRIGGDVYNFHYWCLYEPKRIQELERALIDG